MRRPKSKKINFGRKIRRFPKECKICHCRRILQRRPCGHSFCGKCISTDPRKCFQCRKIFPIPSIFNCQTCKFTLVLTRSHNHTTIECQVCLQKYCSFCHNLDHGDSKCLIHRRQEWDLNNLQHYMYRHGWKKCPNCGEGVEKIDGCENVMCRCGKSFIY
jgi:hypothetical protein